MYTEKILDGNRERTMYCSAGLEFCPYGSCRKVYDVHGGVTLVSYTTDVCFIDSDGWASCTGTYSATTRKHIGAFAKEYGCSYYDFKRAYENGEEFNIYTGEVRKIEF